MYRSAATIISWSDQTGDGQPNYSGILNSISTVNEKYVILSLSATYNED
jgi:hypothetical protein